MQIGKEVSTKLSDEVWEDIYAIIWEIIKNLVERKCWDKVDTLTWNIVGKAIGDLASNIHNEHR
jgi:hypothetical protein